MRMMMLAATMLAVGADVPTPGYDAGPLPARDRSPKHPDPREPSDRNPGAPAQAKAKRERRAERQRATWQGRRVKPMAAGRAIENEDEEQSARAALAEAS
mgnify:FL=1